ncbi:MAG: twin-arginine translocation signal domain-containing protein, partial [Hyphomicrobiales bacterium]|nr:twin-arginine translocation signal domain-containing protein [Hyphomicrobiales bacterium]
MGSARGHEIDFATVLGDDPDRPLNGIAGLTRRQLLQFCTGVAATMGLSNIAGLRMAEAATAKERPAVIWLHGQECTGCSESLLRSFHPTLEQLILDVISL